MELLNPTLRDLEKAEKVLGSLENHYVRQVYPQFSEDFKNIGIADLDNYANYNLQNILDDLQHLKALLDGSPSKGQFNRKIEFLVQLSERALRRALKQPGKDKKILKETSDISNKDEAVQKNNEKSMKPQPMAVKEEAVAAKLEANKIKPEITKEKQNLNKPKEVKVNKEVKVPAKEISPKKTKEASPKKTKENNVVNVIKTKEVKIENKKKPITKEEKLLTKISEQMPSEEGSPTVPVKTDTQVRHEVSEFDWKLTEEQQNVVNSTLKKYDMDESIWKNYILTRVHGDAQLRRMGIEVKAPKEVDCAIETMKFVEELERHMSRKTRSTRKSRIQLKPLNSDPAKLLSSIPEADSLSLSITNGTINYHKSNTLPSLDVSTANHDLLFDTKKPVNNAHMAKSITRDHSAGHTMPLPKFPQDITNKNLFTTVFEQNKLLDSKINPISVSHITSYNVLNRFSPINSLERSFNPNELQDSLRDSLHDNLLLDHPSMYKLVKSQAKVKLPSISSSDSYIDKLSRAETIISHKTFTGRRYKKASDDDKTPSGPSANKFSDSIEDSLRALSLTSKAGRHYELEKNFASNAGTIDSKYLRSFEEVPRPGSRETNGETTRIGNQDSDRVELVPGQIRRNDSLMSETESLNDRSDVHDTSARTLMTVYSNDENSRMAMSRNFMQWSKVASAVIDKEYTGDIRRLCLLGSGSEAKVFLCRVKGIEGEVALKQYDLVESHKKNSEAYDGLKHEFEMLRSMEHDNIIRYLCLYKPSKSKYNNCIEFGIIMEYMQGGSLESLIEDGGANGLSYIAKKKIIKQILSGISFLHKHNVIHRDLKPGNILLSQDKTVIKISDFGISKRTEHDTHTKRTLVGTPWYMAPEVISQEGYSSKADIWSLGCCIFHLVTGHKPYNNANAIQALLLMVNYQNPLENCSPDISAKVDELPGMRDFLLRCFSRSQDERLSADMLLHHPIFDELKE